MAGNKVNRSINFFYCMSPSDEYFKAIIIRAIKTNLKKFPNASHIVYPIYGVRVYSSLASKYPRYFKVAVEFMISILKDYQQLVKCKKTLSQWLTKEEVKKIKIISFQKWIFSLLLTFKSKPKHIPTTKDIQTFIDSFRLNYIKAGDLINDTFIRYKGVPCADTSHWFFKDIMWRAYAIEKLVNSYFQIPGQHIYFGSYSTYIDHGIALRVCCLNPESIAITFGSLIKDYEIHNKLEPHILPSHKGYSSDYKRDRARKLSDKIINAAHSTLEKRLLGAYDESMFYMHRANSQKKALTSIRKKPTNTKGKLLLMLHDFFDSGHIYQWLIFPDFWNWTRETLDFCSKREIEILVKPHPNQLPENILLVDKLKHDYKQFNCIRWVDVGTTNTELFKQRPKAIISAYGSVAAEASFCNIPVILAGDHLGINFSIANVARTQEEYFNFLKNTHLIESGCPEESILYTALLHKSNFKCSSDKALMNKLSEIGIEFSRANSKQIILTNPTAVKLIDQVLLKMTDEWIQKTAFKFYQPVFGATA